MKIECYSHQRGLDVFMSQGKSHLRFAGMLVGTAQVDEDIFAVSAHWQKFLREHGWRGCKNPLQTSVFVKDEFLICGRACVTLSLVHGDQVGHVLLAMQGLFAHRQIDVGILCMEGKTTLARVKADLAWLDKVVTVPMFVVAVHSGLRTIADSTDAKEDMIASFATVTAPLRSQKKKTGP